MKELTQQNGVSQPKPRVYSYTRFSSPEQAKGDSERRQWEAAREFADSEGLPLDETLRMIDKGVSGFKGTNRTKGALGNFLQKVELGEVPRGSILLVENIDRLSREPVLTALETVSRLLRQGIKIQTLSPRDLFTTESVNGGQVFALIGHIQRANSESERKSYLIRGSWTGRRLKASKDQMLTARAPAWLKIKVHKINDRVVSRDVSLIAKAAKAIRQIFKLKLEGFGKFAIERMLNKTASWTPPKENNQKTGGWRASYIEKILRTRAVLGEFQPHRLENGKRVPAGDSIPDYFPRVIDTKTWHAVKLLMKSNKKKGGRTGKATNVFQNLVRCGYCGGPMVFVDKGQPPKGGKYLMCDNGRRGVKLTKEVDGEAVKFKCRAHSVRYEEFQDTMLNNLSKLRPQTVLPHANEQTQQTKILRNAIRGLDGEITNASEQIENFTDQVGRTRDAEMRTAYEERISKLKVHRKELETDKAAKESELRDLNRGQQSFERWQVNLDGLKKAISKDVETRIRLKAHLKEFVNRVDVFAKGHEDNVEHAEELVEEYMPELKREESYPAFRSYQRKRLLSPDGRFYRLHLKITRPNRDNGEIARNGRKYAPYRPDDDGLQIAPISSLSARVSIQPGKDGWRFSGPALDKLLKEFSDGRKPDRFVPKGSVSAKTANS